MLSGLKVEDNPATNQLSHLNLGEAGSMRRVWRSNIDSLQSPGMLQLGQAFLKLRRLHVVPFPLF